MRNCFLVLNPVVLVGFAITAGPSYQDLLYTYVTIIKVGRDNYLAYLSYTHMISGGKLSSGMSLRENIFLNSVSQYILKTVFQPNRSKHMFLRVLR